MKTLERSALAAIGYSVLALAIAVASSAASAQTVKPNVTVVNTTANPVPVTGNIGITGTPTVRISGSVTTHPEEQPADTAVQFTLFDDCGSGGFYTVPGGNRLVIEFVSANSTSLLGQSQAVLALYIKTSLNGTFQSQLLPMPKQVFGGVGQEIALFTNAIPMVAYADENTIVCYQTAILFAGNVVAPSVYVTGHLVAQP